jgi:hypothetical protein
MRIFPSIVVLAIGANFAACKTPQKADSEVKGGFVGDVGENDTGLYVVDWPCFPKRYGAQGEHARDKQDEYCEWIKVKDQAGSWCVFTSSFDKGRPLHLIQRTNNLGAAIQLVKDCQEHATKMLQQTGGPGQKCDGLTSGCVAGRNSDPEICNNIRGLVARSADPRDAIQYSFPALNTQSKKLIQFGLLTPIPAGCQPQDPGEPDGITQVGCKLPDDGASCVDTFARKMRVGLQVRIDPASVNPQIPSAQPQGYPQGYQENSGSDGSDGTDGSDGSDGNGAVDGFGLDE